MALTCVHFPEHRTLAADEALDPAPASSDELADWLAEQLSLLDTGTPMRRSEGTQGAPAVATAAPRFHPQGMDPAWLLISAVQVGRLPRCCSQRGNFGLMRCSACVANCWICCYSSWLLSVLVALTTSCSFHPRLQRWLTGVLFGGQNAESSCGDLLAQGVTLGCSCNLNGAVCSFWPGSLTQLPPVDVQDWSGRLASCCFVTSCCQVSCISSKGTSVW